MNANGQRKYGFKLRTRNGSLVERVMIAADSEEHARRKLLQMYPLCHVLEAWDEALNLPFVAPSFESLADLIANNG